MPTTEPDNPDAVVTVKPVIAIVGRPNVGKSTLYNRLTRSRDAIVDDRPGVTRDRVVGVGRIGQSPYWIVDTGGIEFGSGELQELMRRQVQAALDDADAIIFMLDGRDPPNTDDWAIADLLRKRSRGRVYLAANKAEGLERSTIVAEFAALGLGDCRAISAKNGDGVRRLLDGILSEVETKQRDHEDTEGVPAVAIIGRPNVGKSTLANALLGEQRMVVFDAPGTTRDSVRLPFRTGDKDYLLVDTAGVRRQSRVDDKIEHFSVLQALRAIEHAQVVLLVVDAQTGVVEQDTRLINIARESGRALIVLVNKWDGLDGYARQRVTAELERKFRYLDNMPVLYISALHGSGLGEIMPLVSRAYESAHVEMGTGELNRILRSAVEHTEPPMVGNRRIKLKYAHQGGRNPPHIIIHGNQLDRLPHTYKRYLSGVFARAYGLIGAPVKLTFRNSDNPYATGKSRARGAQRGGSRK